ncbi:MAG: DUF4202 domain-containing protein [Myxococcota bacterium]
MGDEDERFEEAERRLFEVHRLDPRRVEADGRDVPRAVHYHRRLAHWVDALEQDASTAVRLAARCQHVRRWEIPRSDHPAGRAGYKKWRSRLAAFHAEEAGRILRSAGWDDETAERVGDLVRKRRLAMDPEAGLLEDAVCLVFLENDLAPFAERHDPDKVVDVLRKTWRKMTERGHRAALDLARSLPPDLRSLVERAVSEPG